MIQIKRGAATVATVNPLSSSNMTKAVMGDEQITLVWEAPAFVPFYLGDYITIEGSNWTLNSLPTVKKLSQKTWQYNAIFQSTKYELLKAMYLLFDNTDTLPSGEFPLTGTADTFMELLVANLNRVAGSAEWTVGQVIENTDYKNLTFSNEDCLSVLARLADEFETEYHVSNHVIHLKKISTNREITLQYGSTLYDIERSSVDSSDVVTRLYPFGSTKNLASDYRGGNSPLRLPAANGNYIENNVNLYGIIERSKTFDDIYPRLSSGGAGVITSVGDEFTFYDIHLDFNVNDYLLDGTTAKVHFNTGECAGYDFEIALYNHTAKKFVIIANTQENDFTLPTADLKPAIGDKYVLLDIIMPPAYLAAAEAELLAKAQEYINQNSTPKVAYKTTFSAIYAKQNLQNVECGDTVPVYDEDMGINEQIRIIKLQKGLTDFWTVQFDLANTVTATRLERIEGNVAAVENTVIVTNERVNRNNLRAYQNTKELRQMVFDPDGYFDAENIKPLSIETSMLSVGAKSQSLQLSCLLQPNYAGNPQVLQWSAGLLTHFTIADDQIKEWTISQGSITITGDNQTTALYIYARCNRSESTGDIYLSATATKFDTDATYYFFLLGVLHTPISSVRGISLTYGQTTINGQFIKTGVISSIDGATYFNLNTGEIVGNFKFQSGLSAEEAISQAAAIAGSAQTTANNAATAASTAQTMANSATTEINNITSDNILSAAEKPAERQRWNDISNEKTGIDTQATNFGITTEKTAYDNKFQTLANYLNAGTTWSSGVPSWLTDANLSVNTAIVGSTYRTNWNNFYTARQTLLNAISTKAKTLADTAQSSIDNLQIGRNFALGSGNYTTESTNKWIIDNSANWSYQLDNGYIRFTKLTTATGSWIRLPLSISLDSAKTYTLSIKLRRSTTNSGSLFISNSNGNAQTIGYYQDTANIWGVYKLSFIPSRTDFNQFMISSSAFITVNETLDIEYIKIEEGSTATPWIAAIEDVPAAVKHIASAITDGSTVVNGGLTLGNLFFTKDLAGNANGGMSGLNGDGVINWGGSSYAQALADIQKAFGSAMSSAFLNREDGGGHVAFGNLAWDSLGNLFVKATIEALAGKIGGLSIYNNSLKSSTMAFAESAVESLSSLLSPTYISISRQSSWTNTTIDSTAAYVYTQNIVATSDGRLKFKITSTSTGNIGIYWTLIIKNSAGTDVYSNTSAGTLTNQLFDIYLPNDTYVIHFSQYGGLDEIGLNPTNYAYLSGDLSTDTISFYYYIAQTKIGNNGFYSFWQNSIYFYFSVLEGLKLRCNVDMPNGLGGASINSSGGVVTGSNWGKIDSTGKVVKSGSNYTITHNIGDTKYSVILTPKSTNIPYFLDANRLANSIVVTCAGGFDFVLIRTI